MPTRPGTREGPATRGAGRLRRRLLALGLALVLALVLAEVGVRTRAWLRGGHFGPAHRFVADAASGLQVPAPGSADGVGNDSRGFRSPELELPKPPGRVRIAFLGGSTTYCAEVPIVAQTWPARVVEGLRRAHPDVPIDWLNAAAAGYSCPQSLASLEHRVPGLGADVVVINHATNDLTALTYELAEAQGLETPGGDDDDWLSRHSYAWYLVKKNLVFAWRARGRAEESGLLRYDLDELARSFRSSVTALVQRAKQEAAVVVLLTFTQRSRPGQSADELRRNAASSLYYMPYMTPEGIRDAFVTFNEVLREVAAAEGVVLVDGEDEVPADAEHFVDSVHLTSIGCAAQAERVLERLEGALDLRALSQRR